MTFHTHIRAAQRLLNYDGYSSLPDHRREESVANSRIALALAVQALAEAAETTPKKLTGSWPADVSARLLTRVGILLDDPDATVDIHDDEDEQHGRSTAVCRPCGWTKGHGLAYRNEVLDWARDHAADCTALTKPTA